MKDLNFFESYIEKSEFRIDKQWIYYSVAILLIFFIIFYSLFNQIKIRKMSKDISKLKSILEDSRINKRVEEIELKEKELNQYKESLDRIKLVDESVEDNSIIDDYLLDTITSRMPEDVFFTSISIYTDHMELVGISGDKWSVANLGKSLESVEEFKEIFISSISKEDKYYNFILNINLKDVNLDGEDESIEEDEAPENND
ncbi:PilN domain-containing protein [Clostridium sp. Cult2]|uniref:PilN domain-containing protein n=1 Tax=Clostridium sp. Cult2 TaxID=2079003 RepID=UPI001F3BCA1C|nr:PilN domain-containing protein [Clostridium sp. Cult2]MCF6465635.1 hypothetical protein [Clostridium sp. Cult2]